MNRKSLRDIPMPQGRFEMRLSGSGGQGMMLGAMILAEAIGCNPEKNVVQTKSYGPEARGGASKADIVVSNSEIFYPKAIKLDLLLAMTQESLDKYLADLKDHGTLIIDNTLVSNAPARDHFGLPFTRLAREEAGNVMVANMIALGSIAAISDVVPGDTLLNAVLKRAPRGTEETNRLAVEIGLREGFNLKARTGEIRQHASQLHVQPGDRTSQPIPALVPQYQFGH